MSLWIPDSIDEQPEVTLLSWQVYELDDGSRHFVGSSAYDPGRVSSAIVSFDKEKMVGITRSGRVYQLIGPSGISRDGDYVWNQWIQMNNVTDFKDVSEEILKS